MENRNILAIAIVVFVVGIILLWLRSRGDGASVISQQRGGVEVPFWTKHFLDCEQNKKNKKWFEEFKLEIK